MRQEPEDERRPDAARGEDEDNDEDEQHADDGGSAAVGSGEDAGPVVRKQVHALRVADRPPSVDGKLDDPAWQRVAFASDFLQKEPNEGAPPSQRTEVGFLYDGYALYVGARMHSDDPEGIRALMSRRDDQGTSERIFVSLDTFQDRRTAYTFGVTAAGVRFEHYHPEDEEDEQEPSFDPVWAARTEIDSAGWTAELQIPFSQLRFNDRNVQVWGVNVSRQIPARNEDVYWVYVPQEATGWASRFGDLVGLQGIEPSRRLELLPYVAGDGTFDGDVDQENPFEDEQDFGGRVGGDLKMGLGPNLTLDATVNPDFGQVEADPAEVNLTAFETVFDERRPFFIEGNELLTGPGPSYYYSRRIGAEPHGEGPGDFTEALANTTILGAAKLTGRLGSGLSLGALAGLTSRERARTFDEEDGTFDRVTVEPVTGYGVGRLQQEFGSSGSTAGLGFTGVLRDVSREDELAAIVTHQAYAGSADWDLRFADGDYQLEGDAGLSYVDGDPEVILDLQESSARYYQRPDADYVTLDPSRSSLSGYTGSLSFSKRGGRHWLWGVEGSAMSPGFEINDAGILDRADEIVADGSLTYRETRPGRLFHEYEIELVAQSDWNFGGVRTATSPKIDFSMIWKNFWESSVSLELETRALSDDLTRGGPLMGTGRGWNVSGQLSSGDAPTTTWLVGAFYENDELGGWGYGVDGLLELRPGPRWEISLAPLYERVVDSRQFVDAIDEGGPQATFGSRYIFSFVDESEISTQVRVNYVFNPDLSLELYAEPFAASGRFYDYGELVAARSRDLRLYGRDGTTIEREDDDLVITDGEEEFSVDDEDFNVRSFRSSMVLRWEWRPGSTLFLIWQQDRESEEDRGDRIGPSGLLDAFGVSGENVLALKMSYWLPLD